MSLWLCFTAADMFTITTPTTHTQTHTDTSPLFPRSPTRRTDMHTKAVHVCVLVNDISTGKCMWPFCLSYPHTLSLSLSLYLVSPCSFTYCPIPRSPSASLALILWGCLQGCVRQALLSGLPPSSAPLSLELTMMNERDTEAGERGRKEDEGGCRSAAEMRQEEIRAKNQSEKC